MKTKAIALFLLGFIPAFAQDIPTSKTEQNMDRIERCKKNYTELFGGEALTGQGTDSGNDGHSPEIHLRGGIPHRRS